MMKPFLNMIVMLSCMFLVSGMQDFTCPAERLTESYVPAASETVPGYAVTHYDIRSEIVPAEHSLSATAVITISALKDDVDSVRIFLHDEFAVKRASSENRPLQFTLLDKTKDGLFFSPTGVPIDIAMPHSLKKGETAKIELVYEGRMTSVINDVNLISEHLTELALYSSWFPLIREGADFTYSTQIILPANHVCISDGELMQKTAVDGKAIYTFRREQKGMDIPIVASDSLKVKRLETTGFRAEVYFKNLEDEAADDFVKKAMDGYRLLEQNVGGAVTSGRMVYVASPRDGWGYSRVPLVVVPEVYMQKILKERDGKMESLHGSLHEMGHFWWRLASSSTSDDWINESLAEFFSLYACEQFFGREAVVRILKKYADQVKELKDSKPIVDTLRGDRYGYVLYYEKGALIWEMLREKLGDEKLFGVLRKYYAAHKSGPPATTQNLTDTFARETNGETNAFFAEFLKTTTLSNLQVDFGKSR